MKHTPVTDGVDRRGSRWDLHINGGHGVPVFSKEMPSTLVEIG